MLQVADDKAEEELEQDVNVFDPPLYQQRYRRVADVIGKYGYSKVVDFGTAEGRFLNVLKTVDCVENIAGVDVNRSELEFRKRVCQPMTADYLDPRKKPLRMRLFHGDLTVYDSRLDEFECITLIEVVEHLTEPVLAAMPAAIFGKLSPKLVIITTPNADYNVLFKNFSGKRHWDHKFEWTRVEFESWCKSVAMKYNYRVEYEGIGAPPAGREDLGSCSQMAVFESCTESQGEACNRVRQTTSSTGSSDQQCPYELLTDWQHPFETDTVTMEQKITWEAEYVMSFLARDEQHNEIDSKCSEKHISINLDRMLQFRKLKEYCDDVKVLSDVLLRSGHQLTTDRRSVLYEIYPKTEDELENDEEEHSKEGSITSGQFSDAEDDDSSPLSCGGLYSGLKYSVESWDES